MNNLKQHKLRVIFFDAGGVLFETFFNKSDRIKQVLMARGYIETEIDLAIEKANGFNRAFLSGGNWIKNWKEEQRYWMRYFGIIANELGEPQLSNELFLFTHYAIHCKLFPEVKEVLETLKSQYRLGVISNAFPSMDWIFDRLEIRKYFNPIILSSEVNVSKPNEKIYRMATNQVKVSPDECLFIDDKMINVKGARQIGMKALHLDRTESNLVKLLKHLIL